MKKTIAKSVLVIMVFSLLSKVLSFLIEMIIASKYGASYETDAYYLAVGIIQAINPMISVGIWKVFLPEYKTKIVLNQEKLAKEITDKTIVVFSFLVIILSIFVLSFPEKVICIFAPGFSEQELVLPSHLLRILVFILFFNLLATIPSAILQSNESFSKSQRKEIIQLIPTFVYLLLWPAAKASVFGVCFASVVGTMMSAVVQILSVRSEYIFHFRRKILSPEMLSYLKNVPAACLNSIINQLNNIIDKAFASGMVAGSITCLNYGSKLILLVDGVFSNAVGMAFFPNVTEIIAKGEKKELKNLLRDYIVIMSSILMPFMFFIFIFSKDIVEITFGYGNFNDSAVRTTSNVLASYSIGLFAMGFTTIVNDILYILKKTKQLMLTTSINIISNIIFDLILINKFGVSALSLATSVSIILTLLIKLGIIKDYISIDKKTIFSVCLTLLICIFSFTLTKLVLSFLEGNTFFNLLVGGISFAGVYGIILVLPDSMLRKKIISLIRH